MGGKESVKEEPRGFWGKEQNRVKMPCKPLFQIRLFNHLRQLRHPRVPVMAWVRLDVKLSQ